MKILPLFSDSTGVRSMATLVVGKETKIFIDPSAALGPSRYGLGPHPTEELALSLAKDIIRKLARDVDAIVITHYHYDPYDPSETSYESKLLLAKDPDHYINKSQYERSHSFPFYKQITPADGKEFEVGEFLLRFSPPLPHGPDNTKLGYVLSVLVDDGKERFLFASDVQGPVSERAAKWIIEQDPNILYMDGPPTYFLGFRFPPKYRDAATQNLINIMEKTGIKKLILDHHLLRDLKYVERFPVFDKAQELGVKVFTVANWWERENLPLEAWRRDLWKGKRKVSEGEVKSYYDLGQV